MVKAQHFPRDFIGTDPLYLDTVRSGGWAAVGKAGGTVAISRDGVVPDDEYVAAAGFERRYDVEISR